MMFSLVGLYIRGTVPSCICAVMCVRVWVKEKLTDKSPYMQPSSTALQIFLIFLYSQLPFSLPTPTPNSFLWPFYAWAGDGRPLSPQDRRHGVLFQQHGDRIGPRVMVLGTRPCGSHGCVFLLSPCRGPYFLSAHRRSYFFCFWLWLSFRCFCDWP